MIQDLRKKILVTGGNGQLANCIKKLTERYETDYQFEFLSSEELDITDETAVEEYFNNTKPDFCINAAAYTAVDLAESEEEKAFAINAEGVRNLAKSAKKNNTHPYLYRLCV